MEVKKIRKDRLQVLNYLWDIQRKKGYIGDVDVRRLSKELEISVVELDGVISFYHFFHRKPTGKYTIYLDNSIISEIKGFSEVKTAFEKETGAKFGGMDPSGTFGLFETACIGLSDQGPAALINFMPFTELTPKKVKMIIGNLLKGERLPDIFDEVRTNVRYAPGEKAIIFRKYELGAAIKKMIKLHPVDIIEDLKYSGLAGRGGAFFPTGLKLEFCRNTPGYQKYIICNADEGEPGTFKDRVLLQEKPELLLEGMIMAAYVVGATKGIIYLRAEYFYLKSALEGVIHKLHDLGLLGENILGIEGFDFDVRIQIGAGAYVCGEETALLESLEGKRGVPRTRTFFPVEKGFLGKPTIICNVETYCYAARIVELGGTFYKSLGTTKTPGTKIFSISGDVGLPGIYEMEWGVTLKEILELCKADDPWYIQMGGPSGTVLSREDLDRQVAGEDILSAGSVMVFNSKVDLLRIMQNFSNFFIHESCGFCTPCRAGNFLIGKKLEKLVHGFGLPEDLKSIEDWSEIIMATSRCGLGKTSTKFLVEAMEKFPDKFKELVSNNNSNHGKQKKFDLEYAVHDYLDFVTQINQRNG